MDGGSKKKEMASKIKTQLRNKAHQRRDRILKESLVPGTGATGRQTVEGASSTHGSDSLAGIASASASASTIPGTSTPIMGRDVCWLDGKFNDDAYFIMLYLDYVFPFLFPHYRPPVHSGGRSWVLDVLQSNQLVHHTVMSLAGYFFGAVIANDNPLTRPCVDVMGQKLQKHLQQSLEELQGEIRRINQRGQAASLEEMLLAMQAMIQMVIIEVATKNTDNWRFHLDAAIALFLQVMPVGEDWLTTLQSLDPAHNASHQSKNTRSMPMLSSVPIHRPWTTAQTAIRFFTANLITMDVVSSISLGLPPRLRSHHGQIIPWILSKDNLSRTALNSTIFMDEFVGLHNWTVAMLGDVATLDAWKKKKTLASRLETQELLVRGQVMVDVLEDALRSLMSQLETQASGAWVAWMAEDPLPNLQPDAQERAIANLPPQLAFHNKVWICGILLYLRTVMYGWKPTRADIRQTHSTLTESLARLPKGALIRSMVFPFCIAGCLAAEDEEESYRRMVQHMGPTKAFGTVKDALEIMERMWSTRHQVGESWDMTQCLNVLGHSVLLF